MSKAVFHKSILAILEMYAFFLPKENNANIITLSIATQGSDTWRILPPALLNLWSTIGRQDHHDESWREFLEASVGEILRHPKQLQKSVFDYIKESTLKYIVSL